MESNFGNIVLWVANWAMNLNLMFHIYVYKAITAGAGTWSTRYMPHTNYCNITGILL